MIQFLLKLLWSTFMRILPSRRKRNVLFTTRTFGMRATRQDDQIAPELMAQAKCTISACRNSMYLPTLHTSETEASLFYQKSQNLQ